MRKKFSKKPYIIFGIVIVLLIIGLSGCNSSPKDQFTPEEKIIGEWNAKLYDDYNDLYGTFQYIFCSNGSVFVKNLSTIGARGYWENFAFSDDQFIFSHSDGTTTTYAYTFSNNNNQLELMKLGGFTQVLERQ